MKKIVIKIEEMLFPISMRSLFLDMDITTKSSIDIYRNYEYKAHINIFSLLFLFWLNDCIQELCPPKFK